MMKDFISKNALWVLLAAVVLAVLIALPYDNEKDREIARLKQQLAHASISTLQRDTIRDSIEVVTQQVIVPEKIKKAMAADRQLIRDLQLKIRDLESMQTTVVETSDTVQAQHKAADSLFYYSDQWADLRLSLRDTTFYYNIRDSLSTVVYREYRHHFLCWRWGTKGYRLKIVNFNPNSHIRYNNYVKSK